MCISPHSYRCHARYVFASAYILSMYGSGAVSPECRNLDVTTGIVYLQPT